MNEFIYKRKSVRKYDPAELDAAALGALQARIETAAPLCPDIRCSVESAPKARVSAHVSAPHYLIFGSEDKECSGENIGFIGQQLSLYLTSQGLGSCWLGMAKPEEKTALPFVICMSFGRPAEPLFREPAEFKRKPLSKISEGSDSRLEAARLAPSGANAQNWFFLAEGGKIHCYLKKPNPLMGAVLNRMLRIDMGIALCHIAEESDRFEFAKEPGAPERKGCVYMGTVGP